MGTPALQETNCRVYYPVSNAFNNDITTLAGLCLPSFAEGVFSLKYIKSDDFKDIIFYNRAYFVFLL